MQVTALLHSARRQLDLGQLVVARMILGQALAIDMANLTALQAANWIDLGYADKAVAVLSKVPAELPRFKSFSEFKQN